MSSFLLLVSSVVFSTSLWAQTTPSSNEVISLPTETLSTKWGLAGNYSIFEMWVLNKYGFTGFYNHSPSWTWELEYMRGSVGFSSFGIDIGDIKEERFSILARQFGKRNSLNFIYGAFYNRMRIRLGDDLISTVSQIQQTEAELLRFATVGLTWGFGNRWQTQEGYILGVDWLTINWPISTVYEKTPFLDQSLDPKSRDKVRDALGWLQNFVSIGVLKIQIGYSF